MAPELDMGMGLGVGFGMEAFSASSSTTTTSNAYLYGLPSADTLRIDDLLDFSTQDGLFDPAAAATDSHHHHHLMPKSEPYSTTTTATAAATGNCSFLGENDASVSHLAAFPDDFYMPSEEAAELEWLSKFVEDSFSDIPFQFHGGAGAVGSIPPATTNNNSNLHHHHHHNNNVRADPGAVPGRARSKRSRAPANATHLATAAWSSLAPPELSTSPSSSSSSSSDTKQRASGGRKEMMMAAGLGAAAIMDGGGVRKCTHCSSEKTPQWRTGPLGPKTLCNACGVRYKSGRLVPEYRPAASPTFMLTQHSNSHRKVMELRRQKELLLRHHQHQHHNHHESSTIAAGSSGSNSGSTRPDLLLRDYEVC